MNWSDRSEKRGVSTLTRKTTTMLRWTRMKRRKKMTTHPISRRKRSCHPVLHHPKISRKTLKWQT